MPLPLSGALSMSMIRNEQAAPLSNASLRTASSVAGFSTPDAISEFYGYSNVSSFTVTVQGNTQASFGNSIRVWYKFAIANPWILLGGSTWTVPPCTTTTTTRTISSVPSGANLYMGLTNSVDTNIRFNVSTSPICGGVFNTFCGRISQPSITITNNVRIYIAVANSGGFQTCSS